MALHNDIQVIFKLHPVWNSKDEFEGLEGINDNLRVLRNGDIEELIKVTNVLVVRHSMAALEGIVHDVPTVSINSPPIPAGGFYKEVGGTIHADDDEEFVTVMNSLLNNEASVHNLAQKKRRDFLQDYLGLDTMHHDRTPNIRFTELLKDMIAVNPTPRSSMK